MRFKNYLTEAKAPPQVVYDKVRKMKSQGMSDEEISKKLKITLTVIQNINEGEKMAGWIAIYGGKKIEIKKSEAKDLWGAKQLAIKKLKVPKSKTGLLAIDVAYDD